jgi:hypothetical protein
MAEFADFPSKPFETEQPAVYLEVVAQNQKAFTVGGFSVLTGLPLIFPEQPIESLEYRSAHETSPQIA